MIVDRKNEVTFLVQSTHKTSAFVEYFGYDHEESDWIANPFDEKVAHYVAIEDAREIIEEYKGTFREKTHTFAIVSLETTSEIHTIIGE